MAGLINILTLAARYGEEKCHVLPRSGHLMTHTPETFPRAARQIGRIVEQPPPVTA